VWGAEKNGIRPETILSLDFKRKKIKKVFWFFLTFKIEFFVHLQIPQKLGATGIWTLINCEREFSIERC